MRGYITFSRLTSVRWRPSTSTGVSVRDSFGTWHQRPIAITGTRAGSSRTIAERMNQRGAETQPAVAPRPLTCRKIPAPRWRTWSRLKPC